MQKEWSKIEEKEEDTTESASLADLGKSGCVQAFFHHQNFELCVLHFAFNYVYIYIKKTSCLLFLLSSRLIQET